MFKWWFKLSLPNRILIFIVIGIIVGLILGPAAGKIKFVGDISGGNNVYFVNVSGNANRQRNRKGKNVENSKKEMFFHYRFPTLVIRI